MRWQGYRWETKFSWIFGDSLNQPPNYRTPRTLIENIDLHPQRITQLNLKEYFVN